MGFTAKADGELEFHLPDADIHHAVIVDIIDLGIQQIEWAGKVKEQEKINVVYELEQEHPEFDGPYRVTKRYTNSLFPGSHLSSDLEGLRGKGFTDQEREEGIDLRKLYHLPCRVMIEHNESNGRTYANVTKVMPPQKDYKLEPSGFYAVPDYVLEKGFQSHHGSVKNGQTNGAAPPAQQRQAPAQQPRQQEPQQEPVQQADYIDDGSDLPF